MAEEPDSAAAMNLMIAMIRLAAIAAKTAILELLCVVKGCLSTVGIPVSGMNIPLIRDVLY
jgi:hypothetical protein